MPSRSDLHAYQTKAVDIIHPANERDPDWNCNDDGEWVIRDARYGTLFDGVGVTASEFLKLDPRVAVELLELSTTMEPTLTYLCVD